MRGKKNSDSTEIICDRMREEIIPMLYQVVQSEDITFQNPHRVSCWRKKGCLKTDCPAYQQEDIPCWYQAGTYCGGTVQGTFVDKYTECRQCAVFMESCPSLVEEVGEALNHLLFSLRKEKQTSRKHLQRIEHLNKELVSALENLDSRNREIQELVITDKLTGLYNRNYLLTILDDEILRFLRGEDPLTVMMIDLDDFKSINDTYGHEQGDKPLAALGAMLQKITRKYDRSFRYGGEEFVVILPSTDITVGWIVAERIRDAFEKESFTLKTNEGVQERVSLTLSIGLAGCKKGLTASALLALADDAMYKAKSEGKNRVSRYGID
jgi:diguanylate cyclase (GGDEF)-like protein